MKEKTSKSSRCEEFINELLEEISDPVHKRLVQTYLVSNDPVRSMESELGKILIEVLNSED